MPFWYFSAHHDAERIQFLAPSPQDLLRKCCLLLRLNAVFMLAHPKRGIEFHTLKPSVPFILIYFMSWKTCWVTSVFALLSEKALMHNILKNKKISARKIPRTQRACRQKLLHWKQNSSKVIYNIKSHIIIVNIFALSKHCKILSKMWKMYFFLLYLCCSLWCSWTKMVDFETSLAKCCRAHIKIQIWQNISEIQAIHFFIRIKK